MNARFFRMTALLAAVIILVTIGSNAQIIPYQSPLGGRSNGGNSLQRPMVVLSPWFTGAVTPGRGGMPGVNINGSNNNGFLMPPGNPDMSSFMQTRTLERANDTIDAAFDKDGKLVVNWSGDSQNVKQVTFMLLDKDKKILSAKLTTKLPVNATLTVTNKTAYYQVIVDYANGTSTKVTSPL